LIRLIDENDDLEWALSKPFLKEFPAGRTEHLSRSSSSPEFLVVFETRAVLHKWI